MMPFTLGPRSPPSTRTFGLPVVNFAAGGIATPADNQGLTVLNLWKHECARVFCDKLTNNKDKDWFKPLAFTFDFILNAADMTNEFNLQDYMSTLAVNGEFHNVGLPDKPLPQMMAAIFR